MPFRQFDNPHLLVETIIKGRLFNIDPLALVRIDGNRRSDNSYYEYVSIDSDILTDQQIINGLANPITANEIAAISRKARARGNAKGIPNWATWTPPEWKIYFESNLSNADIDLVTNISTAKEILKRQNLVINNLAKMVLAMRDQLWPDL